MNSKRGFWTWPLAITCAAVLASSCGGDGDEGTGPSAPRPGQLTVSISGNGNAGSAFLLSVRGDGMSSPTAPSASHRLYTNLSGDTLTAALIGEVSEGALLKFNVPDVNRASSYRVNLTQVAGADNALLPLGTFTVTITP
jgi:hypothetical protein